MSKKSGSGNRSLDVYIREIQRFPRLSPEEERDLSKRIKAGDSEAFSIMVTSNLRLVVSVVKKYVTTTRSLEDLIGDGNLGLVKAVQRFDGTKGFRFSTYAVRWIQQSVQQSQALHTHQVYMPRNKFLEINALVRMYHQLLAAKGDPIVAMAAIAKARGMNLKKLKRLMEQRPQETSIDEPVNPERQPAQLSSASDNLAETIVDAIAANAQVEELLSCLKVREREVIRMHFGLYDGKPMNFSEIGRKLGYSRERIRVVYNMAVHRIQRYIARRDHGLEKKKQ